MKQQSPRISRGLYIYVQRTYKPNSVCRGVFIQGRVAISLDPTLPSDSLRHSRLNFAFAKLERARPCTKEGFPLPTVTSRDCELLPHLFSPLLRWKPSGRYCLCGTFPTPPSIK